MAGDVKWPMEKCVDGVAARDLTRRMRTTIYFAALLVLLSSTGCLTNKHKEPPPAVWVAPTATNAPATNDNTFTIQPAAGVDGQVASVNSALGFVVLTFPIGQMPSADTHLNVYRSGIKMGELKVTGPQQEDNTVADIVSGEARKGDEVRER
jgi:hypothetical protein